MFAQIPLQALNDDRLNRADIRVLTTLFSFASIQDPVCWPSRAAIAARCGIRSLALISQALSRLVRFGWITDIKRRRGSSVYRLLVPEGTCPPRPERLPVYPAPYTEQNTGTEHFPLREGESGAEREEEEEARPSPDDDEITALIMYFYSISGTQADAARHRKALKKALKSNIPDEIKEAARAARGTWSNPAWITPAAICKPGRVDELRSQAKTAAPTRAACHKPFEREPAPKLRTDADRKAAAAGLAGLKAALAA